MKPLPEESTTLRARNDFLGSISHDRRFRTTMWDVIAAAGSQDEQATTAFARIYRDYLYPLYASLRQQGHTESQAKDLVQGFFEHLIEHRTLDRADPCKGRFRDFLRRALVLFVKNQAARDCRQKRGGGQLLLSFDTLEMEERYCLDARVATLESPERAFDRRWGETVLLRAIRSLGVEFQESGRGSRFDILKVFLLHPAPDDAYSEPARQLGTTANAIAAMVRRMRCRFVRLIHEEFERTVKNPADAMDELRAVLGDLARSELLSSSIHSDANHRQTLTDRE